MLYTEAFRWPICLPIGLPISMPIALSNQSLYEEAKFVRGKVDLQGLRVREFEGI